MTALAKGIAHISFPGGGIFLPARNPYDRQTLMEYVDDNVRSKGQVQILVDDQRWLVRCVRVPAGAGCSGCGHALHCACYSAARAETAYCVKCAFTTGEDSAAPTSERRCRASRTR
jgi:hypothetical protein